MALKKDGYRILGVAPTCSNDEIHKAYRALSKEWHPDLNQDRHGAATQKMQELVEAYTILRNAQTRSDYDNQKHFRLRGNLSERERRARPRIKAASPTFMERLRASLPGAAVGKKAPRDQVVQSQEHFAMGLSMGSNASFLAGALKEFQLAAQLDPSYSDAHFNVGICCYRLGRFDDATQALQKVLSLKRDDADAQTLIQLLRDHEY